MAVGIENQVHFTCDNCANPWSIPNAPIDEYNEWYCPWCGTINLVQKNIPYTEYTFLSDMYESPMMLKYLSETTILEKIEFDKN